MPDDEPFDDLDVPEDPLADLDRATQQLTVQTEERRYGKKLVIIEGCEGDTDLESLASKLKSALGTGGTVKESHIELQGDHEERVRELFDVEHHFVTQAPRGRLSVGFEDLGRVITWLIIERAGSVSARDLGRRCVNSHGRSPPTPGIRPRRSA